MDKVRNVDTDALVIGAGPAGASAAIRLVQAGWRVVLVEQHEYPRQKVCGECIAAGNLAIIDELGIGVTFRHFAGEDLRKVGWMSASATQVEAFPPCAQGPYRYGRALGRDILDSLLLERARFLGVRILQPATVRAVGGEVGQFQCRIEERDLAVVDEPARKITVISAAVIIDAHGSWQAAPKFTVRGGPKQGRALRRASDLFAFKSRFTGAPLSPGLLPVITFDGGYGGIVASDTGQITLACCIRRDALRTARSLNPSVSAGLAVEAMLRHSCPGVREVLRSAQRIGCWLSVGPIRPGIRLGAPCGVYRIGNAAGESHPLIGEGISMALQSAKLLVGELIRQPAGAIDASQAMLLQRRYVRGWKHHFAPRLRLAALYACVAMHPTLSAWASRALRHWPQLLTRATRLAGKAKVSIGSIHNRRAMP